MSVLKIERDGATAVLVMNRPDQRNALDLAMREAFSEAVAQVRDDPSVRRDAVSRYRSASVSFAREKAETRL